MGDVTRQHVGYRRINDHGSTSFSWVIHGAWSKTVSNSLRFIDSICFVPLCELYSRSRRLRGNLDIESCQKFLFYLFSHLFRFLLFHFLILDYSVHFCLRRVHSAQKTFPIIILIEAKSFLGLESRFTKL